MCFVGFVWSLLCLSCQLSPFRPRIFIWVSFVAVWYCAFWPFLSLINSILSEAALAAAKGATEAAYRASGELGG